MRGCCLHPSPCHALPMQQCIHVPSQLLHSLPAGVVLSTYVMYSCVVVVERKNSDSGIVVNSQSVPYILL